jgi:tetratricopeptide (TPR) repeat protein
MFGDRKDILYLPGILLLSLSLMLIYFAQLRSSPLFGFLSLDSNFYDNFALQILSGKLFSPDTVYLNSVYPFFLAIIYRAAGHSISAVVACQVTLSILSCFGIYIICRLVFPRRNVGLVACFLYACYDIAIFYTGFLLDATLASFLLISTATLLIMAHKTDKKALWIFSGAVMGLTVVLKGNILLCLPFIVTWLFIRDHSPIRQKILTIAIFLAGLLITFTPFSVKRYIANNIFSPFPVNGGISFYIGNNPDATGLYAPLHGISDAPIKQVKTSIRRAELETGRKLTPLESSNYWFSQGLRFIRHNPGKFFNLLGRKARFFWNKTETEMNINFEFCKGYLPFFKLPLLSFGMIAPFALCGILWALWRKEKNVYIIILFIVSYFISLLAFFVSSRYRFPAAPFIIIMAAYALCNLWLLLRSRDMRKLAACWALLIPLFLFVNQNIPYLKIKDFASNHNNLGNAYYEKGLLREAQNEYRKAVAINPDFSRARSNLANTYREFNDLGGAVTEYNEAIRINPRNANAYAGLAAAYDLMGEVDKAIGSYHEALKINPGHLNARIELGLIYLRKGMVDEAEAENKAALMIGDDAIAHNNLGNIYYMKGMLEEAVTEYKKALELEPGYADCHNNLAVLYYHKKDFSKAAYHYDEAVKYGAKPDPRFRELLRPHKK